MLAYRLSRKAHRRTAFSGEGARLAGGRWNQKGQRVVYCSESRALAALELFVNLDPHLVPADLEFIQLEVPDALVAELRRKRLPPRLRSYPAPDAVKSIGADWLRATTAVALLVPSAVMPQEHNVLLNPEHPDFSQVAVGKPSAFEFDPRMWRGEPRGRRW